MKTLSEISDQIADLEPQRYKIYKTENMYNTRYRNRAYMAGAVWNEQLCKANGNTDRRPFPFDEFRKSLFWSI